MRISPAPVFLFDLDGTLVDTAPDLLATINTLLARQGRTHVNAAQLRRLVGGDDEKLITGVVGEIASAIEEASA